MRTQKPGNGRAEAGRFSPKPAFVALALFVLLVLALRLDVAPIGPDGSSVGLSSLNGVVHDFLGVNWTLYVVTDWGGLVPVASMLVFFFIGIAQLVRGKSLAAVDSAIWWLGAVYVAMLTLYLLFNEVVINFRPVLVDGFLEPSFPSSTTLLAVGAMGPAAVWSSTRLTGRRRVVSMTACYAIMGLLVVGRALSGVHWITDIIGGILLGLFLTLAYRSLIGNPCNHPS